MSADFFSVLLIGNSRWHWAAWRSGGWQFDHGAPELQRLRDQPPDRWAAVGPVPSEADLDPARRITVAEVPLQELPRWVGVDRALAAWRAWQLIGASDEPGVLVADAGTVLSLTRVTAAGVFAGGQLAPGLALQGQAMAQGTRDLPSPEPERVLDRDDPLFPRETAAAMRRGALQAAVGLLVEAQQCCPWPLWLCGGDAPHLLTHLQRRGAEVQHVPELVLEGLVTLPVGQGPLAVTLPPLRPA